MLWDSEEVGDDGAAVSLVDRTSPTHRVDDGGEAGAEEPAGSEFGSHFCHIHKFCAPKQVTLATEPQFSFP